MTSRDVRVTALLKEWSRGDAGALDQLVPLVYNELRRVAARVLRDERPGHTLQPTALVNEAYLRLVNQQAASWENRTQFFVRVFQHPPHRPRRRLVHRRSPAS